MENSGKSKSSGMSKHTADLLKKKKKLKDDVQNSEAMSSSLISSSSSTKRSRSEQSQDEPAIKPQAFDEEGNFEVEDVNDVATRVAEPILGDEPLFLAAYDDVIDDRYQSYAGGAALGEGEGKKSKKQKQEVSKEAAVPKDGVTRQFRKAIVEDRTKKMEVFVKQNKTTLSLLVQRLPRNDQAAYLSAKMKDMHDKDKDPAVLAIKSKSFASDYFITFDSTTNQVIRGGLKKEDANPLSFSNPVAFAKAHVKSTQPRELTELVPCIQAIIPDYELAFALNAVKPKSQKELMAEARANRLSRPAPVPVAPPKQPSKLTFNEDDYSEEAASSSSVPITSLEAPSSAAAAAAASAPAASSSSSYTPESYPDPFAPKTIAEPVVIILTPEAARACDLIRALAPFHTASHHVGKLFGKHMDLAEQKQFLISKNSRVVVGSPNRILALLRAGVLSLSKCRAIVVDMQKNKQTFTMFEFRDQRRDFFTLLQEGKFDARVSAGAGGIFFF